MTLMVGGPLHGQDIDVKPVSRTALEIAANRDPVPSPSYVDLATGELYLLRPVTLNLVEPQTNRPMSTWEVTVYLHAVAMTPDVLMQAVSAAVLSWWFTTRGTRKDAVSTADSNGHTPVPALYSAVCQQCDPGHPFVFSDLRERARRMTAHREEFPDHTITWSDHAATTEGK
jgi:hypothetical protein